MEIKQSSLSAGSANQMTTKESTVEIHINGMELTKHSTSPANKMESTKHLASPVKKTGESIQTSTSPVKKGESTQTSTSPANKMESTKHLASPTKKRDSTFSSASPVKTRISTVQSNKTGSSGQRKRKKSEECVTEVKSTLFNVIVMYITRKMFHHQRNVIVERLRTGQWRKKLNLHTICPIPSKTC